MIPRGSGGLRIALMLESDGPGGAERVLVHLAEHLRGRGHSIVPVGPDNGCGWLAAELRERGFVPATFSLRRPVDWHCLQGLVNLIREQRIDVVHSHEFTMAVYGAAASRLARRPHIVTMHGGRHYEHRLQRRLALRWAFARSRDVVAVSRTTRLHLEQSMGLRPGRIRVIPNGVAFEQGDAGRVRRELQLDDGEVLLLAVGNLYPVKGHRVLLQALDALWRAGERQWRVAIAGRGDEEAWLRDFAKANGWANHLHLLGYRVDVPDLLAAADIYVMPSLSEGLPLALLEAMFAGKAIVVSDTGGVPEVVSGEDEALLVPPADPAALAAALWRLFSDPDLRHRLGAAARRRAEIGFGVERMVEAYEQLYVAAAPRSLAMPAGC